LSWNDARLLPYFFRHYDEIVDEYFFFDQGSSDGTLDLLHRRGRVHVERCDVRGSSIIEEQRRLSDAVWQRSRGLADWVILVDADEHLYRPDLLGYLDRCASEGVTAIRSVGYEMVAEAFPTAPEKLTRLITRGCRSSGHSRLCIFNPDAILATHFGPGRHRAWPEGHVVWPMSPQVLLLHYAQLGVDFVRARSAELASRLGPGDIENGWGREYAWGPKAIAEHWARMNADAACVPGLGELAQVPPEEYRGDEKIIEESGLLDGDWYLANNRDLAENRVDPLTHFCLYGWREGRQPNFYFDTAWYQTTYPEATLGGRNPLVHYILEGERRGHQPSPHFDTGWYRELHRLDPDESPLRHYLLRRASGLVAPLRDFDVQAYCRNRPATLAAGRDPYEEFVEGVQPGGVGSSEEEFPDFDAIIRGIGLDPGSKAFPATVPWRALTDVIRIFVRRYPFDEEWYRAAYPDVDEAVRNGLVASGFEHFVEHGFFERRAFRHR
jgi:hypothetical protein